MPIDWSRISRITDFCISKLNTQAVINAKAEAIKENCKGWFATYEERNLSDPECHYEATLCKYAGRYHNAALDRVASEHERLIRETPALIFGNLIFIDQVKRGSFALKGYDKRTDGLFVSCDIAGNILLGIPVTSDMVNIYTMGVEIW